MGKTLKEIKNALPELDSDKVKDISIELDRILSIKTLFTSDGGKELIGVLRNNCARALKKSIIAAKNGDEKLLSSSILDYSANIDLLASVQDISMEDELRAQLDEAVTEAFENSNR